MEFATPIARSRPSASRRSAARLSAECPRYAPEFLDEVLIKADVRFTGRAIGA